MAEKIEMLGVIAHPVRIKILLELTKGVKCVSDIKRFLGISQPNASQHLSLLRRCSIIDYYIDGRLRCYFLKNPLIPEILEILKKDFRGPLPPPACCPVIKEGRKRLPARTKPL